MDKRQGKIQILLTVLLATILFSVFIKLDSILNLANWMVDQGWSLILIFVIITLIRMILTGIVVLLIIPPLLNFKNISDWLTGYLRLDFKVVLTGLFSFFLFCGLAAGTSLILGIFSPDISALFARPDLSPDPDVVGWGYFLLALVPGIWEELAYRGLIQSKLRQFFTSRVSVVLSAAFFALFHFSNLVSQPLAQVVPGVVMAFFFGIGWGWLTVKSRSVVPAMICHYLVDSMGQIFLGVPGTDPALTVGFFLVLTLIFPILNILLAKFMYGTE